MINEEEEDQQNLGQFWKDFILLQKGESIDDCFLCSQCSGILIDCQTCTICDMKFCISCLKNNIQIKCSNKNSNHQLEKVHKLFNKMLNQFRFRCPNSSKGCNKEIHYNKISFHLHQCSVDTIKCENDFCGAYIKKEEWEQHKEQCIYLKKQCEHCRNNFLQRDLKQHQKGCQEKIIKCQDCKIEMKLKDFEDHYQGCEWVKEACKFCGKVLIRKDFELHKKEECLSLIFVNFKKSTHKYLDRIKLLSENCLLGVEGQQKTFGIKCCFCYKIACEISITFCLQCNLKFCVPCSRKILIICETCKQQFCQSCGQDENRCMNCTQKANYQKTKINQNQIQQKKQNLNQLQQKAQFQLTGIIK